MEPGDRLQVALVHGAPFRGIDRAHVLDLTPHPCDALLNNLDERRRVFPGRLRCVRQFGERFARVVKQCETAASASSGFMRSKGGNPSQSSTELLDAPRAVIAIDPAAEKIVALDDFHPQKHFE